MPSKRLKVVLIVIAVIWVWMMIWMVGLTSLGKKKEIPPNPQKTEDKSQPVLAKGELASGEKAPSAKAEGKKQKTKEPWQAAQTAKKGKAQEKPVIPVKVYRVARTDFSDLLPAVGTVKGLSEIELRFEINGVVKEIMFREGDVVSKQDVIATLDQKDAKLKLAHAQSKLKSAESRYQSDQKKLEIHQKLYEVGAIIKDKLEEVRLETESSRLEAEANKVEVEFAEEELKKTSLLASRDGVMGPREVEIGEFVTPNEKISTLLVIEEVFVEVGIIEKDIDKIRIGQSVGISVDSYPGVEFKGQVDNLFPVVEGRSRTLTTKIRVSNDQGLLLPGMFARVKVTIFQKQNALVFPSLGLNKGPAGYTAFVIKEEIRKEELKAGSKAKVEQRQVQVGYITTDLCQVNLGVKEGELVVIETQGELSDGAEVEIMEIQEYAK